MEKKKEPSVWFVALKLVALAILVIGAVGFALWYADSAQRFDDPNKPASTPANSWGIVNDSPIRPSR